MLSITVPGVIADPSKPLRKRDPLCKNDNNGVRFLFDAAFRWSYAAGTAEATKLVRDMAEREDSQLTIRADETIPLNANGLDFSNTGKPGCFVAVKPTVMADLFADQQFLICMYLTLPSAADWAQATAAIFQGSESGTSYNGAPDIGMIGFGSGAASLVCRRQTAVGATQNFTFSANGAGLQGAFTQIAMWRTANQFGARTKTASIETLQTAEAGAKNMADFSGATGGFGMPIGFWSYNALTAAQQTLNNFRLHRGFVENLARSERNPIDVLNADWKRQIDRGVFA